MLRGLAAVFACATLACGSADAPAAETGGSAFGPSTQSDRSVSEAFEGILHTNAAVPFLLRQSQRSATFWFRRILFHCTERNLRRSAVYADGFYLGF
jgi:hypothetical protein